MPLTLQGSACSIRASGYLYEHMFPSRLIRHVTASLLEVADAALRPLDEAGEDAHAPGPGPHSGPHDDPHGRARRHPRSAAASRRPGTSTPRQQPCTSPVRRVEQVRAERAPTHRADA
jgi:hypothetical protein